MWNCWNGEAEVTHLVGELKCGRVQSVLVQGAVLRGSGSVNNSVACSTRKTRKLFVLKVVMTNRQAA